MNPTLLMRAIIGLTIMLAVPRIQAEESSCVLRFRWDPEASSLALDAVKALVNSRTGGRGAVLDDPRCIRAVQNDRKLTLENLLSIRLEAAGPVVSRDDSLVLLARLTIEVLPDTIPDAQAVADDVLVATCQRLKKMLSQLGEEEREQLEQRVAAAANAISAALAEQKKLNEEYQALCDQAGTLELDSDQIRIRIRQLTDRRQHLELELAGREAHRAALVKQVAELRDRLQEQSEQDPVAAELERVVDLRQKQVDRVETLVKGGRAPQSDLDNAQESVAQARAEFLERQQTVMEQSGGEVLRKLTEGLTTLAVDIEEARAELEAINAELMRFRERNLLGLARHYESDLRIRMRLVERQIEQSVMNETQGKQSLATYQPPSMTVLGGLSETDAPAEGGNSAP